jgi:hypothetical protein
VGPEAGLDRCGKSRLTGIRSPDLPARSESLYRLRYPGSFVYTYILHIWAKKRLGTSRCYISGLSPKALFPFISPSSRAATLSPELYKKWPRCVNGMIQLLRPCKLEFYGYNLFGITLIQGINEVFNL